MKRLYRYDCGDRIRAVARGSRTYTGALPDDDDDDDHSPVGARLVSHPHSVPASRRFGVVLEHGRESQRLGRPVQLRPSCEPGMMVEFALSPPIRVGWLAPASRSARPRLCAWTAARWRCVSRSAASPCRHGRLSRADRVSQNTRTLQSAPWLLTPRLRADVVLLERMVARDARAVGDLYDRHHRLLFGLIVRILKRSERCRRGAPGSVRPGVDAGRHLQRRAWLAGGLARAHRAQSRHRSAAGERRPCPRARRGAAADAGRESGSPRWRTANSSARWRARSTPCRPISASSSSMRISSA